MLAREGASTHDEQGSRSRETRCGAKQVLVERGPAGGKGTRREMRGLSCEQARQTGEQAGPWQEGRRSQMRAHGNASCHVPGDSPIKGIMRSHVA
eukprot:2961700-Pleurochrysis_carterae.AAC.1